MGLSHYFSVNAVSEFFDVKNKLNSETLNEIPKEFRTCLHGLNRKGSANGKGVVYSNLTPN